ncbi:hypothetical protein JCM8547_001385 [Rhodosporidiobolus lusitaniae]
MIDSLIQFLLDEIAFDADTGTSPSALSSFISLFYSQQAASSSSSSSAPQVQQTIDDAFLAFVWNALVEQEDVRVGVVEKLIKNGRKGKGKAKEEEEEEGEQIKAGPSGEGEAEGEGQAQETPAPSGEGENPAEASTSALPSPRPPPPPPAKPARGRGSGVGSAKKRPSSSAASLAASAMHTLRILESPERDEALEILGERYGTEELRVCVGEETAWAAITGSHVKIGALTPVIYSVLKKIARGREYGTTAVRISKDMGIEPKSVFHCIKVPTGLGLTKKISDIDQGCRTNRIIHVRFLSRSPYWSTFTAQDESDPPPPSDGEEEEGGGAGGGQTMLAPITPQYLVTNRELVKGRVLRVLRRTREGWMVHGEIAGAIGLHLTTPLNLRRLNALLTEMARDDQTIEKCVVTRRSTAESKGMKGGVKGGSGEGGVHVVRLARARGRRKGEEEVEGVMEEGGKGKASNPATTSSSAAAEEEEDDDPSLYPVFGKPVERQILEILMNADARGMTSSEISLTLSSFAPRFIDAILQRLSRLPPPPHLSDFTLHCVSETVGRVKQTRWFSLAGYLGFRREKGVKDEEREAEWGVGEGRWEEGDGWMESGGRGGGPWEGQYGRTVREKRRKEEGWETMEFQGSAKVLVPKKARDGNGAEGKKKTQGGGGRGMVSVAGKKVRRKKGEKAVEKEEGEKEGEKEGEEGGKKKGKKAGKKGEGKEKAVEDASSAAADADAAIDANVEPSPSLALDLSSSNSPPRVAPRPLKKSGPATGKKPTGRPRKNPLPPGVTESPYMRKKREKAEDEERERLGLPPVVREVVRRGGGRRKTGEGKGEEVKEEEGEEGEAVSASAPPLTTGTPVPPAKRPRGRPKKSFTLASALSAPASTSSTPVSLPGLDDEGTNDVAAASAALAALAGEEPQQEQERAAPKRRGRAPKKKAAEAPPAAVEDGGAGPSSAAASTTAPAIDSSAFLAETSSIAPVTSTSSLSAPASSSAAAAPPPQTPSAAPAPPTASKPTTTKKRRLEAYVDIEVRSGSPMSKRVKQLRGNAGSLPEKTPASKKGKEKEKEKEKEQEKADAKVREEEQKMNVSEAGPVAGPSFSSAGAPVEVSTPAPAPHTATPGPSTPQPREGTPSIKGSAIRSRAKRAGVGSKDNLTLLLRQREILDYTSHVGGIWAREFRTPELIRDFMLAEKGDKNATQMDKGTFGTALEGAIKRDMLRKTVGSDALGKRKEIYYLPSVRLDSKEAMHFLTNIPGGRYGIKPAADITLDENDNLRGAVEGDKQRGKNGGDAGGIKSIKAPEPSEGYAVVQEFFRQEAGVLGRSHGVKHGLLARARQLHKWLASFVFNQPDDSAVILERSSAGLVISQEDLLNSMPLGVFVRVIPLPVEWEKLDAFLSDSANHQLPMSAVPPEMEDIIRPKASKRKAAMWNILDTLVKLQLLGRLVPSSSENDSHKLFVEPLQPRHVSHWRFRTTVPVYSVRDENSTCPLVAVHHLANNDTVSKFWSELQAASDHRKRHELLTPIEHGAFCPTLQASEQFKKETRKIDRWRDAYQLNTLQRNFLVNLVEQQENLVVDVDVQQEEEGQTVVSNEVARWAGALFAPVEVVADYLRGYIDGLDAKAERFTGQRKRRRKARKGKARAGEGEEGEFEQDGGEPDKNAVSAALQRKIRGAAEQRERDWNGIVSRFRSEHGNPDLNDSIVDYLHRRFIDPRRQIDARQLEFELRRLLPLPPAGEAAPAPPPAPEGEDGEPLRTVVPLSLIRKARLAKDPYAITRQPNIRKRVRAVRTKNVQRPVAPQHKEPSKPFTTGDQSEFLDVPLPPRPELESGQRLPKKFYTPEQDDLILDAYAVLLARAKLTKQRIGYAALEQLFKGHKAGKLSTHIKRLVKEKPDDAAYLERLVAAFVKVYLAKKEELDDPNPESMTQFDLASFVRCLRDNVDKRVLRLQLTIPEDLPEPATLPATLTELSQSYEVAPTEHYIPLSQRFDKVWSKGTVANNERDDAVAAVPLSKTMHESSVKPMFDTREAEQTAAALKILFTTPDSKYDEVQGNAFMQPFAEHVNNVVKVLVDKHMIVRAFAEDGRRLPGRNYSYNDRFFSSFNNRVTMPRLASASDFEKEVHSDGFDGIFPLIPTEGEILAFFDLVSEGKAKLSIDTSELSEKALQFDYFLTRQANDDDIECNVNIEPVDEREDRSFPPPLALVPESTTDKPEALEAARELLRNHPELEAASVAHSIEQHLVSSGANGVSVAFLLNAAPCSLVFSAVSLLTSPSSGSPLAFFAGTSSLTLVSIAYLSSWVLTLPSTLGSEEEPPKRVWPCIWVDLHGGVVPEVWNRAVGWIKGELLVRAGTTSPQLIEKASTRHLLTAFEVRVVLEALLQAGQVARRCPDVEGYVGKDVLVDWEHDGWSVVGEVW